MGPAAGSRAAWFRRGVTVTVLAAVISPAVRGHDSFPLTTYPMYDGTRGRIVTIATAVGVDRLGATRYLPLRTVADTDDPLIAESTVRSAIDSRRAEELCHDIAARAGSSIAAVEVVDERHDVVTRATGGDSLLGRSVHARCPVRR
jgi:hypothetical protein